MCVVCVKLHAYICILCVGMCQSRKNACLHFYRRSESESGAMAGVCIHIHIYLYICIPICVIDPPHGEKTIYMDNTKLYGRITKGQLMTDKSSTDGTASVRYLCILNWRCNSTLIYLYQLNYRYIYLYIIVLYIYVSEQYIIKQNE